MPRLRFLDRLLALRIFAKMCKILDTPIPRKGNSRNLDTRKLPILEHNFLFFSATRIGVNESFEIHRRRTVITGAQTNRPFDRRPFANETFHLFRPLVRANGVSALKSSQDRSVRTFHFKVVSCWKYWRVDRFLSVQIWAKCRWWRDQCTEKIFGL